MPPAIQYQGYFLLGKRVTLRAEVERVCQVPSFKAVSLQPTQNVLHCTGVDIAMNTHLKMVKLLVKGKPAQNLDSMSIRGSNIRYILRAFAIGIEVQSLPTSSSA